MFYILINILFFSFRIFQITLWSTHKQLTSRTMISGIFILLPFFYNHHFFAQNGNWSQLFHVELWENWMDWVWWLGSPSLLLNSFVLNINLWFFPKTWKQTILDFLTLHLICILQKRRFRFQRPSVYTRYWSTCLHGQSIWIMVVRRIKFWPEVCFFFFCYCILSCCCLSGLI